MKIELVQALSPIYSYAEISKAQQRLTDAQSELVRWRDEAARILTRRHAMRALSESPEVRPDVGMFLANEAELLYTALNQAEAKAATAQRKIEEAESFLRRARIAHEILGWSK